LKALQLTAGPVGAGVTLDDRRTPTAVALVSEVEKHIRREQVVRAVSNRNLIPGDWVSGSSTQMAYGVQVLTGSDDAAAAVFVAQSQEVTALLCGSAEYLLDRSAPVANAGLSMSDPQAIDRLLWQASAEDRSDEQATTLRVQSRNALYAAHQLYREFSRFGLHRLSFLARAMQVIPPADETSPGLIVASPLYVEFAG